MKRSLITAAVALSALTACQKDASQKPAVHRTAPLSRTEVKPLAPKPGPVAAVIPDAGSPKVEAPPVDALAIAHGEDHIDHVARAQQLRTDGDIPGALTEARRAIADDGNDEDALRLIGRLGQMAGEEDMAAEAWARVASLEPQDASPLIQQARVLVHDGKYEEAEKVAVDAMSRDQGDPEIYQVLGRAYLSEGKLQPAIDNFQRVITLAPDHGYGLNNLGLAYLRANRNSDALEVLQRASMILPDVAYVQNNLGIALERTGDMDHAQMAYARAVALSPKYLKAQLNSGRLQQLASASDITGEALPELQEVEDLHVPMDLPDDLQ